MDSPEEAVEEDTYFNFKDVDFLLLRRQAVYWVAEIAVDARIGIREAWIRKLLISATIKVARQEPQWQGHTVSHLY